MNHLKQLLNQVYSPDQTSYILNKIEHLLNDHAKNITSKPMRLTEKDVLLITYADQVYDKSSSRLQVLKTFLDVNIKDEIRLVHLLPFYPYSSDDGFSVIDYYEVNSMVGDWSDVEEFSSDYSLMFDAVINHISQESDWVKKYLEEESAYKDYFIDADPNLDYSKVTRPRTLPLLYEFETKSGKIRNLWTTFSKDQVDLNYENPEVFLHVLDVLLFYVEKGAKLLRLDAIGFMWKKPGTTCIHLPEAHALIQAMKIVLEKAYPDIVLITETNVPHQENISYFGDGTNEAKMVYNFTLPPLLAFSLLSQNADKLTKWAQSLKLPSSEVCFFNFTASHDGVGLRPIQGILSDEEVKVLTDSVSANEGFISYRTAEDGSQSPYELNCNYMSLLRGSDGSPNAFQRFIASQAVMLSMPGLPAIYFHSLVGSENDTEGVKKTGRYRSINREKLNIDHLTDELNDPSNLRNKVFSTLKQLLEVRKLQPGFHPFGGFEFLDYGLDFFAIKRTSQDQKQTVLAVFNFTDQPQKLAELDAGMVDLLGSENPLVFEPYGFKWLELK